MDFNKISVDKLAEFLRGSNVPGTGLAFSEEVVTILLDNDIDGATLLMLIDDIAEFKELIPNAAHMIQLKRIINNAKAPEQEDSTLQGSVSEVEISTAIESPTPRLPSMDTSTTLGTSRQPLTLVRIQPSSVSNYTPSKSSAKSPTVFKPSQTSTPAKTESPSNLPQELPIPDRFSIKVEEAISRNELLSERLQLIKDAANFYYGLCRHPKQGDYARMARKLCEQFPELKDADSDHYWTSVSKQLSMYFRNQRRSSQKPNGKENSANRSSTPLQKKIRLEDDVLAAERNLELLRKTKKSDFSKETYNKLLEETYKTRRKFIQHQAKSVADVLDHCSYLGDPITVTQELERIIGKEKVKGARKMITQSFEAVLKVSGGKLTNQQVVEAVNEVQRRTRKKVAPGKLITFYDQSTPAAKMSSSKLAEFQIVCSGMPDCVEQVFIIGENNIVLDCPSNSLVDGLFFLLSCYYVFDVNYPAALEGILFFLQDLGFLCSEENHFRFSKYNSFLAELKYFNDKCT